MFIFVIYRLKEKLNSGSELINDKKEIELKPFDKILVPTFGVYEINFYGRKIDTGAHLCLDGRMTTNCIPYEGNEHLLGQKVNDNK